MTSAEDRVRRLPIWKGKPELVPLKGGVSNASFTVTDGGEKYVARVGEDYPCHHVSRAREAIASRAAFAAGLSPEVVHAEPGIMVLRFLAARTYGEAEVRANMERCVEIVRRCHRDMGRRMTGPGSIFWVFHVLRDYAQTLKAGRHRHVPDIPRWMKTVDRLEAAQAPLPIVFGHHDLLPTNFMDDGKRLWLIDWEYGAFGTAMFDLANIAANNSFEEKGERRILEFYFGKAPDEAMLRAFYAMKTASALREAVWGMVSELHLNAPGVDYIAYAAEYLGRFERALSDYNGKFGAA
ncbi:MAG TPA: choline/ethanolamine kinase family protein [Aestuariivirga sp.]|nr:choline/ethanolamine kinase family protein [Aestuariivirga sp.]